MTEYEVKILRYLNEEDVPDLNWGAAMSVAIEQLYGAGYVYKQDNCYFLADKGREFLKELPQ